MSELIAVAMSGGVDSSTVAALLKRDGHNIAGLTMQLWNQRRLPEVATEAATGRCCSLDDVYDARRVAEHVGMAAQLATSFRRLASQPWVIPNPVGEERNAIVAGVTEGLLDAMTRGRDGSELVQLCSDALANQLPHDRLELLAAAPAPDCWALVGFDRAAAPRWHVGTDAADAIDGLVHHFGAREILRLGDLRTIDSTWPASADRRGGERLRSVLAARLEVAGEFVGWLCMASEAVDWFREEDEAVVRLAARIVAPRVAAWQAKAELAGAWA